MRVPLFLAGKSDQAQGEQATALLHRLGLGDRLDHKPFELSTGQQQRVALARTLGNDPRIILADEPTGNLDPERRLDVLDTFDSLVREGRTIVMVTHDVQAAERASRLIRLVQGRAVAATAGAGRHAA